MNVGVWAFDRYVMNEDFAKISIGSIRRNIKHGFVWDNDQFSTNLFAHPYHGIFISMQHAATDLPFGNRLHTPLLVV